MSEKKRVVRSGFFSLFFYSSLIFLGWTLYQNDFLQIPVIQSGWLFGLSVIWVGAGFIMTGAVWQQFFALSGYPTRFKECLAASGLSVFGKYIPGKLWVVVGVASVLSQKYHYPLSVLTIIGIKIQLCFIWVGLILGTIGLFLIDAFDQWGEGVFLLFGLLTLIIFSQKANQLFHRFAGKIVRRKIEIPALSFGAVLRIFPVLFLQWIFWSAGFSCLIAATTQPFNFSPATALGFPLAATFGLLAVFAPGGLGVREGILTAYLIQAGLSTSHAATISIAARMWFLLGEIILFAIGIVLTLAQSSNEASVGMDPSSKNPSDD